MYVSALLMQSLTVAEGIDTMNIAVVIGMVAQAVGLVSLVTGFAYGYGRLSRTVQDLKDDMNDVRNILVPRLNDLTRIEQAVADNIQTVRELQEVIRSDFSRRLNVVEVQIAEVIARCKERMSKDEKHG